MSDNFKTLAKDFVDKDQLFQDKLREAILNKQLKKTLVLCSNKALWWQKNKGGLDALETMEFAFEIFRYVFNQMDISPKMKKKMASTVKKKLISVGKKRLKEEGDGKSPKPEKGTVLSKGKPKKPETKRKESGKSEPSESKKPKIFGSSVLPGEEKEGETQKELGEKEAKDSQSSSDSGSQTTSTSESRPISEEEKLRRQRERLRKQRMEKRKKRTAQKEEEEEESEVEDEGERTSATFNPLDRIKQWLRSDEDFWYVVERVRRLPKRTIKIMLDPDTEGIISEIELKYGV